MTDPSVAAGWYAVEGNRNREQYWTGTAWRSEQRWRRSGTPAFPSASVPAEAAEATRPSDDHDTVLVASGWAGIIVALAVLVGIAATIVGVVLIGQGHSARGIAVLVVGVLEAAFVGSFAALHQDVRALRIQVADLSRDLANRPHRP